MVEGGAAVELLLLLLGADGERHRLERLGGREAHERAAAIAAGPTWASTGHPAATTNPDADAHLLLQELQGIPSAGETQARTASLGLALLSAALPFPSTPATLVLLEVPAENEGVCGGEGTQAAGVALAWGMLEPLVQVEVVLALATVAAQVAAEGPLASVHTQVLDELIGRLGEVATLLAAVVVAKTMSTSVPLQLGLVGPHRLADAATVLGLAVGLQVALQGCRPAGGVHTEWAHLYCPFHLFWPPNRLTNLEPSSGNGVALLVLQQLLWGLHELVADVALKHARNQVDLKVALIHCPSLAHKVTEDTFKAFLGFLIGPRARA